MRIRKDFAIPNRKLKIDGIDLNAGLIHSCVMDKIQLHLIYSTDTEYRSIKNKTQISHVYNELNLGSKHDNALQSAASEFLKEDII